MLSYLLLALMMAYASAQHTPYDPYCSDDNSPYPISSFYIDGCTTSPCNFKWGDTIVANIKFKTLYDSPTAPLRYQFYFGGTSGGISPEIQDAGDLCHDMSPPCPLKKGNLYTMRFHITANFTSELHCGAIRNWIDNPEDQRIYCLYFDVCIEP